MQKILMCAPDHFGVEYVINPWMEGQRGATDHALAQAQWEKLRDALGAQAELVFVPPQQGLPDLVFTANAGLVLGKTAIVSRFSSRERQGEEPVFRQWFAENGFAIADWPQEIAFEGAGDALLDRAAPLIWAGYGFRSAAAAPAAIEKILQRRTIGLRLVDPRFYHLDTCLCPLANGYLMYFPGAFDDAARKAIAEHVPEPKRIAVGEADALQFACNAVDLNGQVFLNHASAALQKKLQTCSFTPVTVPLSEFMKSGGAAKCLTLKLDES